MISAAVFAGDYTTGTYVVRLPTSVHCCRSGRVSSVSSGRHAVHVIGWSVSG